MRGLLITILSFALAGWMGGSSWYYVCKVRLLCPQENLLADANAPDGEGDETIEGEGSEDETDDAATDRSLGAANDNTNAADSTAKDAEGDNNEDDSEEEGDDSADPDEKGLAPLSYPVPPFMVKLGGKDLFQTPENYRFAKSEPIPKVPPGISGLVSELADYMKNNPNTELQITGSYARDETNNSEMQNLGIARADYVRQQLIKAGVESDRLINSFAAFDELKFDRSDSMNGGIDFELLTRVIKEPEVKKLLAESKDVYFDWGSHELLMTDDIRKYITRSIQYMKQNPDQKLQLIGHTDNTGKDDFNMKLGQRRANTLLKYFVEFGAGKKQILTSSRGEKEPIATNNTEAGKQKNRRVEIRFAD